MKPRRRKRIIRIKDCEFCKKKSEPDYKVPEILGNYISDRGKISGRNRSGLCAKHQRRITKAIKRARFLALLPFTRGIR